MNSLHPKRTSADATPAAPAPVALFVYRRPEHTRHTIEALARNALAAQTELFVFSDAARGEADREGVALVRDCIREIDGFRRVHVKTQPTNQGLANSIIAGATAVCAEAGRVIVVEDDLVASPHFLTYMNAALSQYARIPNVFSISGYNLPPARMPIPPDYAADCYFNYRPMSWGWATWQDRWEQADWQVAGYAAFSRDPDAQRRFNRGGADLTRMLQDQMEGRIDSWYIRWCFTHFLHDAFSLYPVASHIDNIGHDGSGTHSTDPIAHLRTDLSRSHPPTRWPSRVRVEPTLMAAFASGWMPDPPPATLNQRLRRLAQRLTGAGHR